MTLAEFKAWFEGFTEDMDGQPNAKQWKRIKARVAQIDGIAITREVVYRDRYWPNITTTTWLAGGVAPCTSAGGAVAYNASANDVVNLGKLEYQSMLAS